jgi:response regulator RpfG family c-di-GMP phosphodiesterase
MHRKNAGVSDVLEKLSNGFEKYLRILSHMRGEYLDLMKRFSQGEVYHLERSVDEHAQQELLRTKQDELLELYTAWREKRDSQTEESLERVVGEIRALNPSFKFELPRS